MRKKKKKNNCFYCERAFVAVSVHSTQFTKGLQATRDHVWPASRGGDKTVPCCRACNSIKGDMTPHEWLQFRLDNPNWWAGNWQWTASQVARRRAETLQGSP